MQGKQLAGQTCEDQASRKSPESEAAVEVSAAAVEESEASPEPVPETVPDSVPVTPLRSGRVTT